LFVPLQLVPLVAIGFEQTPVLGLQVPTAWHGSLAVHVTLAHRLVDGVTDAVLLRLPV
jgi:hypothetical protein